MHQTPTQTHAQFLSLSLALFTSFDFPHFLSLSLFTYSSGLFCVLPVGPIGALGNLIGDEGKRQISSVYLWTNA